SGSAALAQEARERIEIGLSTERIAITSEFSGADLTIFGALDNVDPLVMYRGRYDVIVTLQGPPRTTVVRRKERVLGMWMKVEAKTFHEVPQSYVMGMTREPQDIASDEVFRSMGLGAAAIRFQAAEMADDPARIAEFAAALRQQKQALGLYTERPGGVQFLSQTLFRATVPLAPDVPVGTHRARVYLFKNGEFIHETSTTLVIYKAGLEERIHYIAHAYSFLYGLGAVFLAILIGWLGRILF